jgi:flagellar basal-body rod modification protein FlgD
MSLTVNPATAASSSQASSSSSSPLPTQTLGQKDFLNLLVTQLQMQDPLNPQSNTDFIAQMAQFSALSASVSTNTEITQLYNAQQCQQANELLGQTVVLQADSNTQLGGTVSAVTIDSGTPKIVVNGQSYGLGQVVGVTLPQS